MFNAVCFCLSSSSIKEQLDDAKYEYQQKPDLEGKGLCARALYDYQAGKWLPFFLCNPET